jgi:hypothetical protein
MWHRDRSNWPPVWTAATYCATQTATGEVGILRHVYCRSPVATKCFLVIEHDGKHLIGTLAFDDAKLCRQIVIFLRNHVGRSIKEIGDLEIGSSF